jgi:hypothetical protein
MKVEIESTYGGKQHGAVGSDSGGMILGEIAVNGGRRWWASIVDEKASCDGRYYCREGFRDDLLLRSGLVLSP